MKVIGPLGLFVLAPAAWFLAGKAQAVQFDATFYIVQTLEIICGAINLILLSLNLRDGLTLAASRRRVPA